MSNNVLPQSVRARIVEIERRHAEPNLHTIGHYHKHEGLSFKDAEHAERLERELDRFDALASSVGLSEEQRAERNQVSAELDRFVRVAKCHAKKQEAQPLRFRNGRTSPAPVASASH